MGLFPQLLPGLLIRHHGSNSKCVHSSERKLTNYLAHPVVATQSVYPPHSKILRITLDRSAAVQIALLLADNPPVKVAQVSLYAPRRFPIEMPCVARSCLCIALMEWRASGNNRWIFYQQQSPGSYA